MSRPTLRALASSPLLALTIALAPGCGGPGDDSSNQPPNTQQPGAEPEKPANGQASTDAGSQVPAKQVTPNQPVNPDKVVNVVEGEVEGGEAEKGPSREGVLWAMPDPSKVEDSPLDIDLPLGLHSENLAAYVPASNPITEGKYELGRQLYFDPRVSLNGTLSCATCHDPAKGWTDQMPTSVGIDGQVGGRNAPTVTNTVFGKTMFWDGRAPSLEGQAQGPIQNKIEMGDQSYEQIIDRLRQIPGYRDQFAKVFGTDVTLDGMVKAIATFERVASLSGGSKYDRYFFGGDEGPDLAALTESEKRGMVLFGLRLHPDDEYDPGVTLQKAKCTSCHVGFNFTDERFHNLGVGWDASAGKFKDPGRYEVTPVGAKDPVDLGSFKTPTLRDIEKTFPYMHDGSEDTLEAVVEYYNKGGNPNPYLDKDMVPLNLTDQEKADVVAFLRTLTGEPRTIDLPTLPPGSEGTAPDPKAALEVPTKKVARNSTDPHAALAR